jgi:hypothetical protein
MGKAHPTRVSTGNTVTTSLIAERVIAAVWIELTSWASAKAEARSIIKGPVAEGEELRSNLLQ